MTNIFGSPKKINLKTHLFQIGVKALEKAGWKVERIQGNGKSSIRRISKGGVSKIISIRTSQDTWIAFPRTENDKGWRTLDEVDAVVPVSVDDRHDPKAANVHMIDGDEMRDRFNRAYAVRKKAGHSIPIGRGVWVSLYFEEKSEPASYAGAGAGLKHPPFAIVPLTPDTIASVIDGSESADKPSSSEEAPLTILEAKRRLALAFGIDPSAIKITVEG